MRKAIASGAGLCFSLLIAWPTECFSAVDVVLVSRPPLQAGPAEKQLSKRFPCVLERNATSVDEETETEGQRAARLQAAIGQKIKLKIAVGDGCPTLEAAATKGTWYAVDWPTLAVFLCGATDQPLASCAVLRSVPSVVSDYLSEVEARAAFIRDGLSDTSLKVPECADSCQRYHELIREQLVPSGAAAAENLALLISPSRDTTSRTRLWEPLVQAATRRAKVEIIAPPDSYLHDVCKDNKICVEVGNGKVDLSCQIGGALTLDLKRRLFVVQLPQVCNNVEWALEGDRETYDLTPGSEKAGPAKATYLASPTVAIRSETRLCKKNDKGFTTFQRGPLTDFDFRIDAGRTFVSSCVARDEFVSTTSVAVAVNYNSKGMITSADVEVSNPALIVKTEAISPCYPTVSGVSCETSVPTERVIGSFLGKVKSSIVVRSPMPLCNSSAR